jgi:hypothetical protein
MLFGGLMRSRIIWLSLILGACAKQPTQEDARLHGYCAAATRDAFFSYMRLEPDPAAAAKAREFDENLQHMKSQFDMYLTTKTSEAWWDGFIAEGTEFATVPESDVQQFIDAISSRCSKFSEK